jgi:hypothetical protein
MDLQQPQIPRLSKRRVELLESTLAVSQYKFTYVSTEQMAIFTNYLEELIFHQSMTSLVWNRHNLLACTVNRKVDETVRVSKFVVIP